MPQTAAFFLFVILCVVAVCALRPYTPGFALLAFHVFFFAVNVLFCSSYDTV